MFFANAGGMIRSFAPVSKALGLENQGHASAAAWCDSNNDGVNDGTESGVTELSAPAPVYAIGAVLPDGTAVTREVRGTDLGADWFTSAVHGGEPSAQRNVEMRHWSKIGLAVVIASIICFAFMRTVIRQNRELTEREQVRAMGKCVNGLINAGLK